MYFAIYKVYLRKGKNSSYKIVPVKYPGAHWWTCNGNEEDEKLIFEYMDNVNKFRNEKIFEVSDDFYNDLYLMEEGKIFEVEEDKSPSINTREQFEFYKLAKEILDN